MQGPRSTGRSGLVDQRADHVVPVPGRDLRVLRSLRVADRAEFVLGHRPVRVEAVTETGANGLAAPPPPVLWLLLKPRRSVNNSSARPSPEGARLLPEAGVERAPFGLQAIVGSFYALNFVPDGRYGAVARG